MVITTTQLVRRKMSGIKIIIVIIKMTIVMKKIGSMITLMIAKVIIIHNHNYYNHDHQYPCNNSNNDVDDNRDNN